MYIVVIYIFIGKQDIVSMSKLHMFQGIDLDSAELH